MKETIHVHSTKGNSMVIFAVALTVLFGVTSLSVDIGLTAYEKSKLANATDSAALAGAQELQNNPDNALNVANLYLVKNGVDPASADVSIAEGGNAVSVISRKDVKYFFARVLGYEKGEVGAKAVAKTMPISAVYSGVRPFAIENMQLEFGTEYVLKEGGGSGSNGNYGALALGGNGACKYRENIINGYNGSLKVGDYVDTEPGNMSGPTSQGINTVINSCSHSPKCTFDSYHPDCPRIITVIMVESLDVHGRKPVKIVGFASFFLEGVDGQGDKSIVRGRFIKTITNGEVSESQTDYGLRGVKLTH